MYPGKWAIQRPDEAAIVMATSGEVTTHAELDAGSNRVAHLLREFGLHRGDCVAVLLENHQRYYEIVWAAWRSGIYVTPINWHLSIDEAAYIVEDCGAQVLFSSAAVADHAVGIQTPTLDRWLMMDGVSAKAAAAGWEAYEPLVAAQPPSPIADESEGSIMFYSSGTTGRPKGVLRPLNDVPTWTLPPGESLIEQRNVFGFDQDTVYLSPAPLYHAAPLAYGLRIHMFGGTVVVMDRFDPTAALVAIERYGITHSQWVPTMFIRLLDLPDEVKSAHDLSTHEVAIHAAAPCPPAVKHQMMDWWGPIIYEYYAGSEGFGRTAIGPKEWLEHPGSVGRADPEVIFILDENGDELPPGESGLIHFKPIASFEYKGDAEKTAGAMSKQGYASYGDIGYIDEDGFLFLTDRKSFMIISGGVNIYPRETEDALIAHPAVLDAGVFGIPHPDLGEEVKAAVELQPGYEPSDELAAAIITFCRDHLSSFKCPRSVDFSNALPRLPTGKLRKAELRAPYWS